MKKAFIPVLTVSLLLIAHSTFAQYPSAWDRNLILTQGMAEVMGQNDSAKISVAVVTEGRDLEQVSSENAGRTKAVIQAVKGLNIKDIKLKTSNYRVTPQKDYKARPPKIKGYEVHNAIEITLEGFEPEPLSKNASMIIGKALESGSNNINHIQFYIKNKAALEKEALKRSTQEAMDRARTLAEAAGVKLKRIVSLSTQPIHIPTRAHMFRAAEMKTEASAAPPIEIGESQIRVQVSIAYEIE
ncbi:MAG: SIMPL domain-containing protein [Thermodesulfobacteriota bacterium]|nr:SIMPL domain-containing protein [Thermodesulfobacteriota bacterium]